MPKSDTTLLVPYYTIVDSIVKSSTTIIGGYIRIFNNETLTLNNFCIQYDTFFDALESS